MMEETHFKEPLETLSPPLHNLNSPKTLSSSSNTVVERTLYSDDFHGHFSPSYGGTSPENDLSDYDTDSKDDDENDEYDLTGRSPFYNCNPSSHWEEPWNPCNTRPALSSWSFGGMEDTKASEDSALTDWNPRTDLEIKPAFPTWFNEPEPLPSYMGAGLANLGNTCFLNVVLQCFTYTVPLLDRFLARTHKVPCECYSEGFCVFCNLFELIECLLFTTDKALSPWKFVDNLNYFSSSFWRYQQEDAHEFLQCFLDKLESCCNDIKCAESDNMVKQVFGGLLVSKLRCCNCGHCSDTFEPLIDLSLEIDEASSLATALESFTKVEKIEDPETKFTCENCKKQVSVEKQLMLDRAPLVVAFHLKRFKHDGSFVEKIDKHVDFPLELDLSPYICGNRSEKVEMMYYLYAVVVHTGFSSTSGHYYCFIHPARNEWYRFDDSKVHLVHEEYVLAQEAYILFYVKQGTPDFSSFIETLKQGMDLSLLNTSPKSVLDVVDACAASASMPRIFHSEISETSDVAETARSETLTGIQDCESLVGKRDYRVGDSDKKENMISPLPLVAYNSSDVSSCEINKSTSASMVNNSLDVFSFDSEIDGSDGVRLPVARKSTSHVQKKINSSLEGGQLDGLAGVVPTTPSRSPSPEIYEEDPPDTIVIPRGHLGHLRPTDQISCRRQLNRGLEDFEREQASRLVKKTMPGSRGKQFMAAMCGSSEGSLKKRGRMHMSTSADGRNPAHRRRSGSFLV